VYISIGYITYVSVKIAELKEKDMPMV